MKNEPAFHPRALYTSDGVNKTKGGENPEIDAVLESALSDPAEQNRQTADDTLALDLFADDHQGDVRPWDGARSRVRTFYE